MLSLNLFPPSNVTVCKSSCCKYSISAPLLNPNLVNRSKVLRNSKPGCSHGKPFGSSKEPICQIYKSRSDFGKNLGNPFRFSSRFSSPTLEAASETPQEPGPDVEIEALKQNKKLKLAVVFGLWCLQNFIFNVLNKRLLNMFPYPWFLASFQLFCGSVWTIARWFLKLQPCPKLDKSFIIALLVPALFHTIGHISSYVSLAKFPDSFPHVICSAEPVFSVAFSSLLGDSYPLKVWLSILPIVLGSSLVSFNLEGLRGAVISNIGFVLRNIYSKKCLQSFKEVNGLNLYGWISIISFLYLFPVAVFVEGSQWVDPRAIATIVKPFRFFSVFLISVTPSVFYLCLMLSGILYHLYNQSSYRALEDISPLTFSVVNTMMRVVVILAGVLAFRASVDPVIAISSGIAMFGTFLYFLATFKPPKIERGESKAVAVEPKIGGGETKVVGVDGEIVEPKIGGGEAKVVSVDGEIEAPG